MDCVNHQGVAATAYCQNCGKPLCAACVRSAAPGQVLCEADWAAWQAARAPFAAPFAAPPPGAPNPGLALGLGFIPGVGAMYNGQFIKGFIHVAVFVVLVGLADHFDYFGFGIAAWIAYQVFDAWQTAKARRDGLPLPDPLGLNELSNTIHANVQTGARQAQPPVPPVAPPVVPPAAGPVPPPAGYQTPFANPYAGGYQPPPPFAAAPIPPIPPTPPMPPVPPVHCCRRVPIAAIILIAMGVLFLLAQFDWFSARIFEFTWPVLLIALGVWLIFRRVYEGREQGNEETRKQESRNQPFTDEPEPAKEPQQDSQKDSL